MLKDVIRSALVASYVNFCKLLIFLQGPFDQRIRRRVKVGDNLVRYNPHSVVFKVIEFEGMAAAKSRMGTDNATISGERKGKGIILILLRKRVSWKKLSNAQ